MNNTSKRMSAAGLLIAIGIVYGDIGTSPLYVMKSIVTENGGIANVNRELIVGSISLILWTVTLLTTVKYVMIALKKSQMAGHPGSDWWCSSACRWYFDTSSDRYHFD